MNTFLNKWLCNSCVWYIFSPIYVQIPRLLSRISLRSDCLASWTLKTSWGHSPTWCQLSFLMQYINSNWVFIIQTCLHHWVCPFVIACGTSYLHIHWLIHCGLVTLYGESSGLSLVQVMASSSRYRNQCLNIGAVHWQSWESNLTSNTTAIDHSLTLAWKLLILFHSNFPGPMR